MYTLLGSLTFSGKVLKKDPITNYTITTHGTSTGSVGCPRLQLSWRGSPRFQKRWTLNNEGTLAWSVLKRWNPRSNQITREPSIPLKQGAHGWPVTLHRGETLWPGFWVRIRAEVESENVRWKYSKDLKNKMKRHRTKRCSVDLKREMLT